MRRWRSSRRARATRSSTSAAASGTRPSRSPRWSARPARRVGVDAGAQFIAPRAGGRGAGLDEHVLPRRRRPDRRPRRPVRHGLLAHGHDVLLKPRGRAAQRAPVAQARRPAGHGRLAPARGQRVALQGPADRRGDREPPEEYDEPTCGPGPFSMSGADTTSDILLNAGFGDIVLHRCDLPILIGRDVDEAIEMVMALGPAGEILRLQGDRAVTCTARSATRCGPAWPSSQRPDGVSGRRRPGSSRPPRRHSTDSSPIRCIIFRCRGSPGARTPARRGGPYARRGAESMSRSLPSRAMHAGVQPHQPQAPVVAAAARRR